MAVERFFLLSNNHPQRDSVSLLEQTKKLLRHYNIRAKKGLGQNFLVDDAILQSIIQAADLKPTDTVIEVGPGLGLMTAELARRAGWVIAIELDNHLADILNETLQYENIVVLNEDILGASPATILQGGPPGFPAAFNSYKVVANLPYYITSAVIRRLLEGSVKPTRMVLTVQSEVAERICARPGKLSLLALSVQVYGSPQIGACIPASAFFPTPQVDSTIVTVELFPEPVVPSPLLDLFFRLAKAGFSQKRKTLRNALSAGMHLSPPQTEEKLHTISVDPMRRAETLTLKEWKQLTASWDQ